MVECDVSGAGISGDAHGASGAASDVAPETQQQAHERPPRTDPAWPAGLTFEQVLARARAREQAALSVLYRHFLPAVYRFLLARVSEVSLAEDLTSETFFAVMSGIADVRAQDELGFATWVLGIARNKLSQHFRRLKQRRELPLAFAEGAEPATTAEEDDPLMVITARESWAEVVAALDLLTPEQRAVLLQRCILGRSTEDVARMLGKPANAIYGLQFRALASLARHLARGAESADPSRNQPRRTDGRAHERRNGHAARGEA